MDRIDVGLKKIQKEAEIKDDTIARLNKEIVQLNAEMDKLRAELCKKNQRLEDIGPSAKGMRRRAL